MSRDIFNRSAEFGGSFAADLVTLNFGKLTNAKGAVVQRIVLGYQQQVQRLFEIGSPLFYYVGGRASGEAALSKILGPGDLIDQFIRTYGDICSPEALQISLKTGCGAGAEGNVSYSCGDCVATSIGLSLQAQDTVVNQDCRMMIGWIAG
jgi:hypothetical protein